MNAMQRVRIALLGIAVSAAAATPASAQLEARYRFKEGEQFQYERTTKRTEKRSVIDRRLTETVSRVLYLNCQIDKVETFNYTPKPPPPPTKEEIEAKQKKKEADEAAGKTVEEEKPIAPPGPRKASRARVTETVTRVTYRREGREGIDKWDSEQPAKGEAPASLTAIAGAAFTYLVDDVGNVTDLKITPETEKRWADLSKQVRARLTGLALRRLVPFASLPEESLRRGLEWTEEDIFEETGIGKRSLKTKYDYIGVESRRGENFEKLRIRAESKMTDVKPKFALLSQSQEGEVYFDADRGSIAELSFSENYHFNPVDAKKPEEVRAEAVKTVEERKSAPPPTSGSLGGGTSGGGGSSGGSGSAGGSSGGDPGGSSGAVGGGRGGGSAGGGGGAASGERAERHKKAEIEKETNRNDKSIEISVETSLKLSFRGKPLGIGF
jgi:hypothetical protein